MLSDTKQWIASGQSQLAVIESGQGLALIFLHSGVTDQRVWEAQRRGFQASYRTITYDRRGYGETQATVEAYSETDDLLRVLDSLQIEQAILVGNSKGGGLVLDFTVEHPERVKALVLVNTSVSGAPQWQLNREILPLEAVEEELIRKQDLDGLNELEARIWLDGSLGEKNRVRPELRKSFLEMNGKILRAGKSGEDTDDVSAYSHLAHIQQPTLIVVGDLDFPDIQSMGGYVAHVLSGGDFRVMAGTAHLSAFEQPEVFNFLLRDFLEHLSH